jgi:hypothetical protein
MVHANRVVLLQANIKKHNNWKETAYKKMKNLQPM